jgi:integrase
MKRDIFGHKDRYEKWKANALEEGIIGLTKKNSDIILQHILDMEIGVNISNKNKKGARSYPRLNNIRQRLSQMSVMLQERGIKDITQITEKQLIQFFSDIRSGIIRTKSGEIYRSVGDYAKLFTSFWHWWMKINRKQGKQIIDICEELDKSSEKTRFVYITKEQLDEMLPYFTEDEQILLMFTFDSIIRAPTELFSLRVKDIFKKEGVVWVTIPAEISKTHFERSFNLLYSGDAIWKHIEKKELKPEDYVFDLNHKNLTGKMQKVAQKLFGDKISDPRAGNKFSQITLYDLRHGGAIHLRILAQKTKKISLDAIRQRGGWVDFKMLNHYTQFIGLDGSIDKEDLLIEEDKSRLQRDVERLKKSDKKTAERLNSFFEIMKHNPEMMKEMAKRDKEKLQELFAIN